MPVTRWSLPSGIQGHSAAASACLWRRLPATSWNGPTPLQAHGYALAVPTPADAMKAQLVAKLRPDGFTAMSGKMAAIVGYILDEPFSDPAISEIVVTSDGFVLAETEGDVGANEMLGSEGDLNRNLVALIEAAGLTADEVRQFGELQRERIRRYGSRRG